MGSSDPVERVALVAALGRLDAREAVPALLDLGEKAKRDDPELLMAVLAALCEIQRPEPRRDVLALAEDVLERTRRAPGDFRVPDGVPAPQPDRADPPALRAQIIATLALCLQVRVEPLEREPANRLLSLLSVEMPEQITWAYRGPYPNRPFAVVPPPARYLFLDTLAAVDDRGLENLRGIAANAGVEPALRGFALTRLPWRERGERARKLLWDPGTPVEMKIQALALLEHDQQPSLEVHARDLVRECAGLPPGAGDAPERYLYFSALRALDERKRLKAEDLTPLLVHPGAPRFAYRDLPLRVRALVQELVDRTADRAPKSEREERVDALLDELIETEFNPRITEDSRRDARRYVLGQLSQVRKKRKDAAYLHAVRVAVTDYMLGFPSEPVRYEAGEFVPPVLLEEEILLALGRTGEPVAVEALVEFLATSPAGSYRAIACLALGVAGDPAAAGHLLPILDDEDPFTRYCAYESLRHLTGQEFFADWMYGAREERAVAAEQYAAWVALNR